MKFIFSKDIRDHKFLRNVLWLFCITFLFALPCEILVFGHTFGYFPDSISQSILGNPDVFLQPMTLEEITLYVHIFLFLKLVSLITLFAFIFRTPLAERVKIFGLNFSFATAVLKAAGLYGVVFLNQWVSYVVWFSFFAGELIVFGALVYGLWFLVKGPRISGGLVR